ncbi:6222_t:CDS:2, partial [Gigaspora margarita]
EELNNPSKILEATENDVIFLETCESDKENLETFTTASYKSLTNIEIKSYASSQLNPNQRRVLLFNVSHSFEV